MHVTEAPTRRRAPTLFALGLLVVAVAGFVRSNWFPDPRRDLTVWHRPAYDVQPRRTVRHPGYTWVLWTHREPDHRMCVAVGTRSTGIGDLFRLNSVSCTRSSLFHRELLLVSGSGDGAGRRMLGGIVRADVRKVRLTTAAGTTRTARVINNSFVFDDAATFARLDAIDTRGRILGTLPRNT